MVIRKTKILIVEDEQIIAYDLKISLERHGYEVLPIASTAREAKRLVCQNNPDVILMDVLLKGYQTGIDAACEIQSIRLIPVIFLTGNQDLLNRPYVKKLQKYRVISKPPTEFELLDGIEQIRLKKYPEEVKS